MRVGAGADGAPVLPRAAPERAAHYLRRVRAVDVYLTPGHVTTEITNSDAFCCSGATTDHCIGQRLFVDVITGEGGGDQGIQTKKEDGEASPAEAGPGVHLRTDSCFKQRSPFRGKAPQGYLWAGIGRKARCR